MQVCHAIEDAKKCWCPFVRHTSDGDDASCNRESDQGVEMWNACIADRCMAWRWTMTHIRDPKNPTGDLIASHDTHGFCGLAGQPRRNIDEAIR